MLPASIADSALKTASGNFLKVILYIFRHSAQRIDAEKTAEDIGVPVGEVNDALLYWSQCGVLCEGEPILTQALSQTDESGKSNTAGDEKVLTQSDAKKTESADLNNFSDSDIHAEPTPAAKKESITVKPSKLTYNVICQRIEESEEVRTLFHEAEIRLGRVIGSGDQSSLLLLHDYYGLPVEVILALCEYARISGKCGNMNYIYTIGVDWSKREIDTLEEADEEFKRLQQLDLNWLKFCEITGNKKKKPTAKQAEFLSSWLGRYHFTWEVITCAYEEMSKHTSEMSFPYMNKILTEWYKAGVDSTEKIKRYEQEFSDKMAKKAAERENRKKTPYGSFTRAETPANPASYDIEKAQQKAKAAVPTLKKKEKR